MRLRYDKSSKWLIDNYADAILKLAGVTGVVSWKALPGEVVQSRQLPDGLVEVRLANRLEPVLFLLEINTYPDNRVPGELLDDLLLTYLNRRELPEVVTLILCPKGNVAVSSSIEKSSPLGWSRLQASWRVVNLWELEAKDFLPLSEPGLAPWIALTRIDGPPEPVLQQCRDVIEAKTTASQRANLLAVTEILGGLCYDEKLMEKLFRGGSKVIESPVLQKWFAERELIARQETILELLQSQCGKVSEDIVAQIKLIDDRNPLLQLTRIAARCNSLDEFRSELAKTLQPH